MADLEISNMSTQDMTVAVKQEGENRLKMVRRGMVLYLLDAEPTPELEAMHRSKKLNVTYRTRD